MNEQRNERHLQRPVRPQPRGPARWWLQKDRCSGCKFCGWDMGMDPYCASPTVLEKHPYGLNINRAIEMFCGDELKLREPREEQ